jgi:hypothetical protein
MRMLKDRRALYEANLVCGYQNTAGGGAAM